MSDVVDPRATKVDGHDADPPPDPSADTQVLGSGQARQSEALQATPPTVAPERPHVQVLGGRNRAAGEVLPGAGDRYRVEEKLGAGGMGVVYRAHDRVLDRDVALKVLFVREDTGPETIRRFEQEARAAATLDHPNIVRVHDVGVLRDGAPFYTMELLRGRDLAHAVDARAVGPREAVEAVRQVALALHHAHQQGILHRDIKPQNVFLRLGPDDKVGTGPRALPEVDLNALLLDFGLAKLSERDVAAEAEGSKGRRSIQTLTRSGEIVGTPAFMAPEQAKGERDVDRRLDVYGLGATLYYALTGRPPFQEPTLAALLAALEHKDPESPRRVNGDIDRDLETLCLKCLQKSPKDRYADAASLAEDCRRWLAGEPLVARPVGTFGRLWRKAKRNRAVAIPVATLSFVLMAGLAMWGGVALRDLVKVRRSISESEGLLRQGQTGDALETIKAAQILAPDDRGVKHLVARIYIARGRAAYDEYVPLRERVRKLEAEEAGLQTPQAMERKQVPPLEERRKSWYEAWGRADVLREARYKRGGAWSSAVSAFADALKHVEDEPEALGRLAELYWDEYRSAEVERRPWDAQRLEPLVVKYGGREFEDRVCGVREVRVRFQLPPTFASKEIEAYLFEYRPCDKPPVLIPVPYDLEHGRPLRDRVPSLAADPSEWEPVPLDVLKDEAAGAQASPSSEGRVERVRWGTIYPLEKQAANRVRIPAATGVAAWSIHLPKGSYLLWVPAGQDLYETRYPFEVAREYEWNEVSELPAESVVPPLPAGTTTGPEGARSYWAYLPPGPYRASGDPGTQQTEPRPAAVLRVPEGRPLAEVKEPSSAGCWMARFKVTGRMYQDYLNDREWHKRCDPPCGEWGHVPRKAQDAVEKTAYWRRDASGRFLMPHGWEEWPILGVSWRDGTDYCKWLTAKAGGNLWRFDLPTEDDWERAARGTDGRFFPWGDTFHLTFCRMNESRPEQDPMTPEPFGLFPLDEGPFGVRDLAGDMEEMTSTLAGARNQWRIFKGGDWSGSAMLCHAAYRRASDPEFVGAAGGLRVIARRVPPPR